MSFIKSIVFVSIGMTSLAISPAMAQLNSLPVPRYHCELETAEQRVSPSMPVEIVSSIKKSVFFDLQNDAAGNGVLIRENEEDIGTGKYGQIINSELKKGGMIHPTLEIYHDIKDGPKNGSFVNLTLLDASIGGSQARSLISLPDNKRFTAKIEVQSRDSQGSLIGIMEGLI